MNWGVDLRGLGCIQERKKLNLWKGLFKVGLSSLRVSKRMAGLKIIREDAQKKEGGEGKRERIVEKNRAITSKNMNGKGKKGETKRITDKKEYDSKERGEWYQVKSGKFSLAKPRETKNNWKETSRCLEGFQKENSCRTHRPWAGKNYLEN